MGNYNGNLKIFRDECKWRVTIKLYEVLKAVLWLKFIALNNCIKKEEMPKINIIKQHFRFSLREDTTIYIVISAKRHIQWLPQKGNDGRLWKTVWETCMQINTVYHIS